MINLKSDKNQKTNETRLVQILFYTFPLWFIVGNLAVSLNTMLFIAASLFLIKKKQLTFRFNNLNWLLIIFFSYFFLSTTIHFLSPEILNDRFETLLLENNPIVKSFMLIRFLILIIIIDTLFFNKILNFKKLFLFSLLCTSFVSFDIILQYITGFDLFGFKRLDAYGAGPFGDEFIAGSYLKNFSFFSFFYIFETFKNKNFNIPLLIFIIVLHLIATLLTGNRIPLLLFLFGCVLIILLIKNLRFVMFLSLLIFLLISFPLVKNDIHLKNTYTRFLFEINIYRLLNQYTKKTDTSAKMTNSLSTPSTDMAEKINFLRWSGHGKIFNTAILMWKERPLTGFGYKSFRIKCWDMLEKDNAERKITQRPQNIVCSNHAHNYYLELLSEAGIVGTSLMVIFFLILLKNSFFYIKKYNQKTNAELILLVPVIINIFIEIWPVRSSGSFFTTWGATFFWLNVGIFLSAQSLFKTENANYG